MTGWLRRAGEGTVGSTLIRWSIAEGSRGRRWRWTVLEAGSIVSTTLLELTPDGRFSRLERETERGSLTAHPEPDGRTLHGNVVRAGGVDPIAGPWQPQGGVAIADDPFGSALCPGTGVSLVVHRDGGVRIATGSPAAAAGPGPLPVDARGIPTLDDAREWPLEA